MPRHFPHIDPAKLSAGGRKYWDVVTEQYELDDSQKLLLLEACRCKDRLDKLDAILRGDSHTWMELRPTDETQTEFIVMIDKAAATAVSTQNMMKQLVATLRLPDTSGRRKDRGGNPGSARGAYNKGKVSSLERARQQRA